MASAYQSSVLIGLFLAVLAGSFAGTVKVNTIHQECTDGIDNDLDQFSVFGGGIDATDPNCLEYPYSDGNGESETPISERYNSLRDYPSLFEYHKNAGGFTAVCDAYGAGIYDPFPTQKAEADIWLNAQGAPRLGCPP